MKPTPLLTFDTSHAVGADLFGVEFLGLREKARKAAFFSRNPRKLSGGFGVNQCSADSGTQFSYNPGLSGHRRIARCPDSPSGLDAVGCLLPGSAGSEHAGPGFRPGIQPGCTLSTPAPLACEWLGCYGAAALDIWAKSMLQNS